MKLNEHRRSHRILVIDDNASIHEDFRKILTRTQSRNNHLAELEAAIFGVESQLSLSSEFEIDCAFQGREGLELVRKAQSECRPYALAFVDGRMPPGWDGVETINHLWQERPDLQVVLCTAYADYSWQDIQRLLGDTDSLLILKKPFDNVEVLQLAHALTRKWELNCFNNELVSALKASESELRRQNQELKETQAQLLQTAKLASLGELSAGVAHELNQPLTVIRTIAQLIRRYLSKGQTDIQIFAEYANTIERNSSRMMNIINHLRTFSRLSSSDFDPVSVHDIIEDSLFMISEQLRIRNIAIEKQFSHELPMGYGNANQLEQVFLNLIANARDAISQKTAIDRNYPGKIEIITQHSEAGIEILFKDNGCGIPEHIQDKIFDPFFTTKEVGQGTGLGLSISYGIIKKHNGNIEIAQTSPAGTTIRILLPLSAARIPSKLNR